MQESNPEPTPRPGSRYRSQAQHLSVWVRLLLLLSGWLLVLVGIAGLILPGIQGILTIVAGAAVHSLVRELAYDILRWSSSRWPRLWRRILRLRLKIHGWLTPRDQEKS